MQKLINWWETFKNRLFKTSSSQNMAVGVDPAKPGGDSTVLYFNNFSGELLSVSIPPLKTFSETLDLYKNFKCDGRCFPEDAACRHIFVFKCPSCGDPIRAGTEDLEYFAGAPEGTVCMRCWSMNEIANQLKRSA